MYNFDLKKQYFMLKGDDILIPDLPLTVTLQINRNCNLNCIYCSEFERMSDLSYANFIKIIKKLKGVKRIIISGGEPLLHEDLIPILKACRENFEVVAMASNLILMTQEKAKEIIKYVDYIDVTVDGLRKTHNEIRGKYDEVIKGIINYKSVGGAFSLVMVLFEKNKQDITYVLAIADLFGAEKMKVLTPIPKGRGNSIADKRLSSKEIETIFSKLKNFKDENDIKTKIVISSWNKIKEGHAILIHPDGKVVASPVWTKNGCIDEIGNINSSTIQEIWNKYPYKENHIKKYIEKTMLVY